MPLAVGVWQLVRQQEVDARRLGGCGEWPIFRLPRRGLNREPRLAKLRGELAVALHEPRERFDGVGKVPAQQRLEQVVREARDGLLARARFRRVVRVESFIGNILNNL